jgi:drug/metabolite transporter (DMT)-like permease
VLFVVLVRLILRRGSFAPPRAVRGWFAAAATAYFVAFVSLQLGMQYASVGIVSLVGSLAAGVTAVTAWRLGHERLHPGQYFGIALGIVGLMLLSL